MKRQAKKTDHKLVMLITEVFENIQNLFEDPLTNFQRELILKDGLVALTQMLIQQPYGECSLAVLYDDSEENTQLRNLIQDLPQIWQTLEDDF